MTPLDALVAISVSDSSEDDLRVRGLTADHVRHAFVELARQILAAGGSLAYGGDLRHGGYTQTLFALLHTYSRPDRPGRERVRQYLAAPVWSRITDEDKEQLAILTTPVPVGAEDQGDEGAAVADATAFTAMRELMADDADARVVLGGRVFGQQGRWPGIVEEAYLALRADQPLFVAGGFGGPAARLARALRGEWPEELTDGFQRSHGERAGELIDAGCGAAEGALRDAFGGADLRNGLDAADNEALLDTSDTDLIAALVLRGLGRIGRA